MKYNIFKFLKKNLIEFTGLSKETVEKYIIREKSIPNHIDEWNFWNPINNDEINWFYVCSRAYIFASARHVLSKDIFNRVQISSVILDFGGGIGHATLPLALYKKCEVHYFDINLIQREFIKFIKKKYNLPIKVVNYNSEFEPIIENKIKFDYIFAFDVFEHLPDYPRYIKLLSRVMKDGSEMYVIAPFGQNEPSHFRDIYDIDEICKKCNLIKKETLGKTIIYLKKS
ncbi:MAG: class I SAM-dependent methyltransferase [Promethearchaeota archaeon]